MAFDVELVRALAGPIATTIAAIAATWITYKLGKGQLAILEIQAATAKAQRDIAKSQRDIAYDKLKHDLFDKRYEIYVTAKELIEHVSGSKFIGIHDPRLREMRLKLDEARFFFPQLEVQLFSRIENLAAQHEVAHVGLDSKLESAEFKAKQGDVAAAALMELVRIYERLPTMMEKELGFEQLRQEASERTPPSPNEHHPIS